MLPLFFGCCNALRLALEGAHTLLLCDAGQDFDQDVVNHIEYPVLLLRQFNECGGNTQDLYKDSTRLKTVVA